MSSDSPPRNRTLSEGSDVGRVVEKTHLSRDTQKAISDVLPAQDSLDNPDFDPIEYLNKAFPDEASLAGIGAFVTQLRRKIRVLDEQVRLWSRCMLWHISFFFH